MKMFVIPALAVCWLAIAMLVFVNAASPLLVVTTPICTVSTPSCVAGPTGAHVRYPTPPHANTAPIVVVNG